MKRYFIFGVLTILIITLNFAFAIVLVADEASINYNVLLLMWAGVILTAFALVYLLKRKPLRPATKTSSLFKSYRKSSNRSTGNQKLEIYSQKAIKKFKIYLPQDLTPKIQPGFFLGSIKNEEYAQDLVQGLYDGNGQLLGFLNKKKKKRLSYNLSELYKDPVICWGNINWDKTKKTYKVKAFVPVLFSQGEMNWLRNLLRLKTDLIHLESNPSLTDRFLYLEKAEKILYLQQTQKPVPTLHYQPQQEVIEPLLRRILLKNEPGEILRLKKFTYLLKELTPAFKQEIIAAIEKAENRMVS